MTYPFITQGICQDGAAILKDGHPMTIEEILADVRKAHYHDQLVCVLKDALGGWRYIRDVHGDLYGVGWDRVEDAIRDILSEIDGGG